MVINKSLKLLLTASFIILLTACSSKPKELMPDSGPTTKQVYNGHVSGDLESTTNIDAPEQPWQSTTGVLILADNQVESSLASKELDSLRRDFRRLPNPEVLAFVYPHFAGNQPIPGYFTMFKLYSVDHYALSNDEGQGSIYRITE